MESKYSDINFHMTRIPIFFEKPDKTEVNLKQNQQARVEFLQKLSKESVNNEELQHLWALLEKLSAKPLNSYPEPKIDYIQFKQILQYLKPNSKLRDFISASTFARLQRNDAQGKISIPLLFNYVMRKIWMQQARVALSLWDSSGNGYLTVSELENYMKELIPTLAKLNQMDTCYQEYYINVVVRKFFFFLDPYRFNKIKILDILCSGFLDQLLELRNAHFIRARDEFNWFSPENTIRIYNIFQSLDRDQSGTISKTEFRGFGNFTEEFIDRLFDVCITTNREIDFKVFVDIIIALENRKEIQSLYFFFPILDVECKKYLDDFALGYFFKPIQKQMKTQGQEPIDFVDFSNEIFDMVRPVTPKRIYIEDLLASGYADTIVSILIDLNGFYAYENRDSNIHVKSASGPPN